MKKRQKIPGFEIVVIKKNRLQSLRTGAPWFFRVFIFSLVVGAMVHNQYALSSVKQMVSDLKKSLLMTEVEAPIKKLLDKELGGKLNGLQKIKITKRIVAAMPRGIDPYFSLDLIRRESSFNPKAVSEQGALGLLQLLPSTAKWVAEREGLALPSEEALFDPVTNVHLGMAYLEYLAENFSAAGALRTAYQQGPTRARAHRDKGGIYVSYP